MEDRNGIKEEKYLRSSPTSLPISNIMTQQQPLQHPPTNYQKELDHVSIRVGLGIINGVFWGSSYAILKGHHPFTRIAIPSGISCALISTACFGMERLVHIGYVLPRRYSQEIGSVWHPKKERYVSHVLSGVMAGGLLGGIYKQRPLSGVLLFTPLMVGVAFVENSFEDWRQEKIQEKAQLMKERERNR